MCVFGSSVRMQVCFLLLLIQLHVTEGCRLEGNREIKPITAYTGDSVLLPCSCTDLHTKPETFTWRKDTNDWVEISPEREQYKDRFQLVNDHSSGNLSLLISHLTEEDGGVYSCVLKVSEYRDFRLTVKGCTLNQQTVTVTGYVGQSVLLPCSCSELQAKPHTFRWIFLKESDPKEIFPKDETNRYTDRVQLFNDCLPGNLSLLISHLTVEDGGDYKCSPKESEYGDFRLTVKGCRLEGNRETKPITAYTGGSVLLPCSCTDLHTKPETFTWRKYTKEKKWVEISPESEQYKDRFQLVNDHSSGNLSLLISHLTEEDGGDYKCSLKESEYRYFRLTVKDAPTRPSTSTAVITTTSPNSKPDVTTNATKPTSVVKDKTTAHTETSSDKGNVVPDAQNTYMYFTV
ncbi:immunoglobulin superfamily member 10-like [Pangasianodon hypophthalmus]|uniref:immunoglobulin superfamily member 10-like n=1 Tax=Pangasianodon hypophthalmus TaxID=310915 RepID=UPI00230747AD|nr:immunoglobulin superfamily member 10-like [Pangasianodon hypophthalmus]